MELDKLLQVVMEEIADMTKSGKFRSREDVHTAYELVDIVKDIYCVYGMEDGGSYDDGSYQSSMNSRDGGSYRSYRSSRDYSGRRDSMGRYARRSYSDGTKEEMISKLERLMKEAPDQRTRDEIEVLIQKVEQG